MSNYLLFFVYYIELLENDFFAGRISEDLPVQFFKAYKPKIFDSTLKREIIMKNIMLSINMIMHLAEKRLENP